MSTLHVLWFQLCRAHKLLMQRRIFCRVHAAVRQRCDHALAECIGLLKLPGSLPHHEAGCEGRSDGGSAAEASRSLGYSQAMNTEWLQHPPSFRKALDEVVVVDSQEIDVHYRACIKIGRAPEQSRRKDTQQCIANKDTSASPFRLRPRGPWPCRQRKVSGKLRRRWIRQAGRRSSTHKPLPAFFWARNALKNAENLVVRRGTRRAWHPGTERLGSKKACSRRLSAAQGAVETLQLDPGRSRLNLRASTLHATSIRSISARYSGRLGLFLPAGTRPRPNQTADRPFEHGQCAILGWSRCPLAP